MKLFKIILCASFFIFSGNSHAIEITPFFGYRSGGEVVDDTTSKKHSIISSNIYGFLVSAPYVHGKTLELYYSHQSSDIRSINITIPAAVNDANIALNIDYLHIGGTAPISTENKFKTFVSGGLGFTYLSPDLGALNSELRFSLSLGVGLKYPISENISLRLETRGLATMFNNNSSIFCSGGCTLSVNGSFLFQGEIFAGLAIGF